MLRFPHFLPELAVTPRDSSDARWRFAAVALLVALAGCNQQGGQPAPSPWPWSTQASQSAWGGSAEPAPTSASQITELQIKADEQAKLAAAQQQRIEQLRAMQSESLAQMDTMQRKQLEEKMAALREQQLQAEELDRRATLAMQRYNELDERVRGLDRSNQDLHAQLARAEQQSQLLEDQNQLLRNQLQQTSTQLAEALKQNTQTQEQYQALNASLRRKSGASITANNSQASRLTAVTVAGLAVRQDGDLVRIELPSDELFEPGTARIRPQAQEKIDLVSDVILRNYSRQVIGVEAHCDPGQAGVGGLNAHQLTAAQAVAVVDSLSRRNQLLPNQLFVLGHGANYPRVSNGTNSGQSQNRRVEIVVYPDTVGQR